jgi:CheY-like chemotaxis protein
MNEFSAVHTVLHVDNDLGALALTDAVLQRQRPALRLITATSGLQGMCMAEQHHPDLVILDLGLPDIDGGVVLAGLRAQDAMRDVPVVVLSADARPTSIKQLLDAGVAAYLTKPVDISSLVFWIDHSLRCGGTVSVHGGLPALVAA